MNFGIPILFNIVWCGVFQSCNYQAAGKRSNPHPRNRGDILCHFPRYAWLYLYNTVIFAALMFSMITAMDSTTNSIAALSTSGISPKDPRVASILKVMWGIMFAVLSYVMLTISGIDGIKLVSNLGGLPNIFILLGGVFCVLVISSNVKNNLVDIDSKNDK
ncbi:MAG: BCCT family transporter [[Clostridium] scindens]